MALRLSPDRIRIFDEAKGIGDEYRIMSLFEDSCMNLFAENNVFSPRKL
jgi:hypothetical protein